MNILKVPCSSGSTSIVHRVTATLVRCFYCVAVTCNRRQDFTHILVVIEGWDHIQSIQHHAFYIDLFASNSYTFHLFNIILPIVEPYCNRWNKNMLIKLDSLEHRCHKLSTMHLSRSKLTRLVFITLGPPSISCSTLDHFLQTNLFQ